VRLFERDLVYEPSCIHTWNIAFDVHFRDLVAWSP